MVDNRRSQKNNTLKNFIGSSFFLGYLPLAPGTFGALPGVLLYYCLWRFLPHTYLQPALLMVIIVYILTTHFLTDWATDYWKSKDPSQFVLDEVIGFLCVPVFYQTNNLFDIIVTGFILFRVLDIIKLPIAKYVDKNVEGSTGIILDDIISAMYAALCLYGLSFLNIQFN